ncbi:unnamed protein product [Staurois parvus]|uniref:Uncharacterized protein n=1 Tax=Staurois parvus TaxID=386267 RepID=A0ABN9HMT8_9NEOB|nr:unnamed protein product [Staurois parvus]
MVGMDLTQPGTRSWPPRNPSCGNGRRQWRIAGRNQIRARSITAGQTVQNGRQEYTGHNPGSATGGQIKG